MDTHTTDGKSDTQRYSYRCTHSWNTAKRKTEWEHKIYSTTRNFQTLAEAGRRAKDRRLWGNIMTPEMARQSDAPMPRPLVKVKVKVQQLNMKINHY